MERIDGALGLPEVPACVAALRERIAKGDLELDLTGVTAIDVAGLQMLLSARADAAARGHAITLRMPQEGPIPDLIERLGLEHAFATAR